MKEEEIRPESLFNDYLALAENDVKTFFLSSPFRYVPCPACGATERSFRFRKMGFDYEECNACGTLYVNPRPPLEAFQRYYSDSPSVNFWATHFYRETEEARRIKLVRPKAAMVVAKIETYRESPGRGLSFLILVRDMVSCARNLSASSRRDAQLPELNRPLRLRRSAGKKGSQPSRNRWRMLILPTFPGEP